MTRLRFASQPTECDVAPSGREHGHGSHWVCENPEMGTVSAARRRFAAACLVLLTVLTSACNARGQDPGPAPSPPNESPSPGNPPPRGEFQAVLLDDEQVTIGLHGWRCRESVDWEVDVNESWRSGSGRATFLLGRSVGAGRLQGSSSGSNGQGELLSYRFDLVIRLVGRQALVGGTIDFLSPSASDIASSPEVVRQEVIKRRLGIGMPSEAVCDG